MPKIRQPDTIRIEITAPLMRALENLLRAARKNYKPATPQHDALLELEAACAIAAEILK